MIFGEARRKLRKYINLFFPQDSFPKFIFPQGGPLEFVFFFKEATENVLMTLGGGPE